MIKASWIFQPEDENIARDHDDVEEEHCLSIHGQLDEVTEPTEEPRHGAKQVPGGRERTHDT